MKDGVDMEEGSVDMKRQKLKTSMAMRVMPCLLPTPENSEKFPYDDVGTKALTEPSCQFYLSNLSEICLCLSKP